MLSCCGSVATYSVKSPLSEVDQLWHKNASAFARAVERLVQTETRVLLSGGTSDAAVFRKVQRVIGQTSALADLFGRRRMALEVRAVKSKVPPELQEQSVFRQREQLDGTPILPDVSFQEAVDDLIKRTPEIRRSAKEVSNLYQTSHGFAMARSTRIEVTKEVQRAIARLSQVGGDLPKAEEVIQELGPFTRSYAEVVYRTNLNTAYTAGRFRQAADPDVAKVMGAFEYLSQTDGSVRRGTSRDSGENHLAANGLIASVHDPIWDTVSPPSGYNCRCAIRLVSKFELKRKGLLGADGQVTRHEPPGFSKFQPHANFGRGRPDRAIYGLGRQT